MNFVSYVGAKYILEHAQEFKIVWNDGFEWLMGKGGLDFMLAGDTTFHAKQRKLMGTFNQWSFPLSINLNIVPIQVLVYTGISGSSRSAISTSTSR